MEDALTSTPRQIHDAQLERLDQDPYTITPDMSLAMLLHIAQAKDPAACRAEFRDLIEDDEEPYDDEPCDRRLIADAQELIETGRDLPAGSTRIECLANDMDLPAEEFVLAICRLAIFDVLNGDRSTVLSTIRTAAALGHELRQRDTSRRQDSVPI